jgi:aspartate 1-decarboxylase
LRLPEGRLELMTGIKERRFWPDRKPPSTYAIRAEEGSCMISVNGAAAHKAGVGDRVIICAYANYSSAELINFKPRLIYLAEGNAVKGSSNAIPVQVA